MTEKFSIKVPRINPNDDELLLVEFNVNVGDEVQKDHILVTVESSKATFEIEAPCFGTVTDLCAREGAMLKIGEIILKMDVDSSDIEEVHENEEIKITEESQTLLKSKLREKLDTLSVEKSGQKLYLTNQIDQFNEITHGENCYVGWNVTMSNVKLKDNVWINRDTHIYSNNNTNPIEIGSGSYIGPYVWIEGHGGINIGRCVHITGPGTCLYTHSGMKTALKGHYALNPDDKEEYDEFYFEQPINIGNNVWIGPNCTIFPGTTIGNNVVVLPNTLVKSGKITGFSLVHPDGRVEKNSSFVKNLSANAKKRKKE